MNHGGRVGNLQKTRGKWEYPWIGREVGISMDWMKSCFYYYFFKYQIPNPWLIVALFEVSHHIYQHQCLATKEWINNTWYVDKADYYSAIRKNGILSFEGIWMYQEDVILALSEIKERQNHMTSFTKSKLISCKLTMEE